MKYRKISITFYIIVIGMIALPLISLLTSLFEYPLSFTDNPLLVEAIKVSFKSSMIMMVFVIILGTPIAYVSARLSFKGKKLLDIMLDLPLVLPPAVAGLLLLMTLGKESFIGSILLKLGWQIPFSLTAVILAQLFVTLPVYIKTLADGFRQVDPLLEQTAMTLGDSTFQAFIKISLPLAKHSILTGAIMAWARGIAEFGATIMFAGNMPSITQTLPLAIYSAMESDMTAAMNIARFMVIVSLMVLLVLYKLSSKEQGHVKG